MGKYLGGPEDWYFSGLWVSQAHTTIKDTTLVRCGTLITDDYLEESSPTLRYLACMLTERVVPPTRTPRKFEPVVRLL